jgi:hypothetical protein
MDKRKSFTLMLPAREKIGTYMLKNLKGTAAKFELRVYKDFSKYGVTPIRIIKESEKSWKEEFNTIAGIINNIFSDFTNGSKKKIEQKFPEDAEVGDRYIASFYDSLHHELKVSYFSNF